MKLSYSPEASFEFQFTCEPPSPARRAAVDAIRHWGNSVALVSFAAAGHGYTNTDCFFGVTYPGDLDEYDLTQRPPIPAGYVEVIAWYGERDGITHLLPEREYVELLRQYLWLTNQPDLSERVSALMAAKFPTLPEVPA